MSRMKLTRIGSNLKIGTEPSGESLNYPPLGVPDVRLVLGLRGSKTGRLSKTPKLPAIRRATQYRTELTHEA